MSNLSSQRVLQVRSDPRFRELVSARARLRWSLSGIVLAMFFGYLLLISFASHLFKPTVGAAVPLGILISVAFIPAIVCITGIYVHRSNTRLDALAAAIHRECEL